MNADILNDLAARVEALEGADREVDAEIAALLRFAPKGVGAVWLASLKPNSPEVGRVECCTNLGTGGPHFAAPKFTASVDAALTLVPPDAFWRVGHDADDPAWMMAHVSYDRGEGRLGFTTGTAETAAMAMTAAAIRAHATEVSHG